LGFVDRKVEGRGRRWERYQ